jgi:glycosyl hydrolase family 2
MEMKQGTVWSHLLYGALLALAFCWSGQVHAADATWKPAPAPLVTRWAREVRPDRVRPEYPRPLLVRKDWKSLNGLWEFAFDDKNEGRAAGWHTGKPLPLKILVPFTFEAALSGIGKGAEIHERVWYRRTFDVPPAWRRQRIRLNFNASDWHTTVWVNGREMGLHQGGYDPFSFDITGALKKPGPQEVVVAIYDPADPRKSAYQPKGKQLGSEGIWYTRTTGIWQTVWLEPVHPASMDVTWVGTDVQPDTRKGQVALSIRLDPRTSTTVELTLARDGKRVASRTVTSSPIAGTERQTTVLTCPVENAELWSPERPVLYDLTLRAKQGKKRVDEIKSYCAFRRYEIQDGRLTLNGRPYLLRGVLDQGYWPDGILTPPTDDAIRSDVLMTKLLGFNMARKHVKVEDPRWYYWCDRMGVAVWQDMPSSHNLASPEAKENFRQEWRAAVGATRSYPSVLHWIPFNENWGDPGAFQDDIVRFTRALDPSRPITDASGWTQRSLTDVIDVHDYGNNLVRHAVQNPAKPKVIGEYGGIALPVPNHTWTTGWGYQTVRDPEGLLRRIRYQTSQLFEAANLSGFVYTQLTDVEQELNGLLTYDRIPKTDPARFAAIFEGRSRAQITGGFVRDWLVLGPIAAGTNLRSAQDTPESQAVLEGILQRAFVPDEARLDPAEDGTETVARKPFRWKRVRTPEDALDFHKAFGMESSNAVAYAVATINSPQELKDVTLLFSSDDAARVWLNGRQVWTVNRVRGVGLDDDIVRGLTLQPGKNVLVVKVAQGIGGWGLAARFERPDGSILTLP